MVINNSIESIGSIFNTKNQYETNVTRFDFKMNKDNNELLNGLLKNSEIDKKDVRFFRVLMASDLFNKDFKKALDEIQLNINKKTNVVSQAQLKCDYLIEQISKFNDIKKNIVKITGEYPDFDEVKLFKFLQDFLPMFAIKQPQDGIMLKDDFFDSIVQVGERVIKKEYDKSIFCDFNINDIFSMTLIAVLINIRSTVTSLLNSNRYILETIYDINNEGILTELNKKSAINNGKKPNKIPFDDINNIFEGTSKIEKFYFIEKNLIQEGKYLEGKSNGNLKWKEKSNSLICFIHTLNEKGYLIKATFNTKRKLFKSFFENRYNHLMKQQFEEGKAKIAIEKFKKRNFGGFNSYFEEDN